jgi:uncharacterized protein
MAPTDRIESLDILRGIALLGMFLVHFNDAAIAPASPSRLSDLYQTLVTRFFEERFWAMFGILFGAGFAVQLLRADARRTRFVPLYLRRLLALAAFGAFTHAVLGYHVLLEYAIWGLPLLLFRRWPIRALMIALVLSAASGAIYAMAVERWRLASEGEAVARSEIAAEAARNQAFREANAEAQRATDYTTVLKARLRHMAWFYVQWYTFLPVNTLTLFLIGLIGFRLGLFDRPAEHRGLIVALMAFGIASWAVVTWLPFRMGFGLIREMWLAFAYIGAVLLLVAHDSAWLRRLAVFGWTGRMALTNYIVQVAILNLLFSNYALGLRLAPLAALAAGVALFAGDAAASRWWLDRFRFGPFEWLWRWATYARRPPIRLAQ